MNGLRRIIVVAVAVVAVFTLFPLCLTEGAVAIPGADVWAALTGQPVEREVWRTIVCEIRVPMAVCAACAGMALALSGLLMQTLFRNPLAGPSIMGISSGASLGVGLVVLAGAGGAAVGAGMLGGALAGSLAVMAILLGLSMRIESGAMLLIVGVLIGYLASSAISLLNFFAPQQSVHAFVMWGLGNFTSLTPSQMPVFATLTLFFSLCAMLYIKALDALLLGERYAANLGVHMRRVRRGIMFVSGALTAIATAWCGPIAFIGLAVPHVARLARHVAPRMAVTHYCSDGRRYRTPDCAAQRAALGMGRAPGQRHHPPAGRSSSAVYNS